MSKIVHKEFTEELQQLLNKYEVTLKADGEDTDIDIEDSLFPVQCVATMCEYVMGGCLMGGYKERYTTLTIERERGLIK